MVKIADGFFVGEQVVTGEVLFDELAVQLRIEPVSWC